MSATDRNTFAGRPLMYGGLDLSRPAAPLDEPTAAAEIAPLKAAVAEARAQRERAESVLASVWPEYRKAHSNPPVYTEQTARSIILRYNEIERAVQEAHQAEREALTALSTTQREHQRRCVLTEWARTDAVSVATEASRRKARREALFASTVTHAPAQQIGTGLPERLGDMFKRQPARFADSPTDAA